MTSSVNVPFSYGLSSGPRISVSTFINSLLNERDRESERKE